MTFSKKLLLTSAVLGGTFLGALGTQAEASEVYTVQSGDTLSKISAKFVGDNSLVQGIANLNNIADINMIYSGEQLTIDTSLVNVAATYVEPVYTEPVQEVYYAPEVSYQETYVEPTYQAETYVAPAQEVTYSGDSNSAKEWIAQKESNGSYTATNGQYIGRYQLSSSYLNGDYSAENQERVADQYVANRYGSWENAQSFWMNNGWY